MPGCTLVMDTSSSPLLLALEKDGRVFTARRQGIKQEKLLFPVLRKVLAKAQADLKEVSRIVIIRGPGRFTGIRIALTFASMMQLLNRSQVYGVTIFEVLKHQACASRVYHTWKKQHPNGALAVVLHAFREEYFLQIFDASSTGPQWLSREELLAKLTNFGVPLFVCGTDKNFTALDGLLGTVATLAAYKDCRVRPQTLLALAQEASPQESLEPLYLKPARFELEVPK